MQIHRIILYYFYEYEYNIYLKLTKRIINFLCFYLYNTLFSSYSLVYYIIICRYTSCFTRCKHHFSTLLWWWSITVLHESLIRNGSVSFLVRDIFSRYLPENDMRIRGCDTVTRSISRTWDAIILFTLDLLVIAPSPTAVTYNHDIFFSYYDINFF